MTQPQNGDRWNSKRRLRLRVTLWASVEYIATCSFLFIYWRIGLADGAVVLGLLAYSLCANLFILTGIASGWSERLADPSMTAIQMTVSCGRDLLGCYFLPALWFVFAFNLFIAIPFGSLQFTNRTFAWFWMGTCAGLGVVFFNYPDSMQIGFDDRTEKFLLWLFLSAALARLMLFNSRISSLRRKLRSSGVALAQAGRRDERERVARELHETVMQTFLGLVFRLTALTEQLPAGSVQRENFETALRDAEQSLEQGHAQIAAAAAPEQQHGSLAQVLRRAGEDQSYETGLAFKINVSADEFPLLAEARSWIEATMLQALANAFHHSRGHNVWLELGFSIEFLTASVRDDGRGMAKESDLTDSTGHFGILIMRERAENLGAALSISSSPGGTLVTLRIPGHRAYDLPRALLPGWLSRFLSRFPSRHAPP